MTGPAPDDPAGVGGAARALPAHRLRSFEEDETLDLTELLPPRRSRLQPAPPDESGGTAGRSSDPAEDGSDEPAGAVPPPVVPAGTDPGVTVSADPTPATPTAAGPYHRKNKIKPSSVHIPARVKEKILQDRARTQRSNGEIIIAAIEHANPRLGDLLGGRPAPTGGNLFAARASRAPRMSEGDLTPLNVRLYEADWDVIDSLVAEYGAASRGHLISTALLDLFQLPPRSETR